MGADTEVFIFDYQAFKQEVVPAFRELLLSGQAPDWLQRSIKHREMQPKNWGGTDLLRYCTYLQSDFSWIGPYDDKDTQALKWPERACKVDDCPAQNSCPFHQNGQTEITEPLAWLFQKAVSLRCLGPSQFVGRSYSVAQYRHSLSDWKVTEADPLRKLLALLGKRGFVIGYMWGFGFEGINGWLDADETDELAQRLNQLPLPRYEVSFEAMKGFVKPDPILYEGFRVTGYEYPGFSFEALSLSFVRTVAEVAAQQSKGILWGSGVTTSEYSSQPRSLAVDS